MDHMVKLKYEIHSVSSSSGIYQPKNIMEDRPSDLNSRWSSETNTPPQFITLKLMQPAIVKTITFGKYEKVHVCNLKRFKVYGGLNEDNLIDLLDDGLKNDNTAETFCLKYRLDNNEFPCKYIKIVPVQTWAPTFNCSIWYVELHGIDNQELVMPHINWINTYREREAIRLCLKHFRQQNYNEAFDSLQKRTKVHLEAPILTRLHHVLVDQGDYIRAENIVNEAHSDGLFGEFVGHHNYKSEWWPIIPPITGGLHDRPGMRGGHQMVFDSVNDIIYLFGGWDGQQDLADFWCFKVKDGHWTCLSSNTALEGGPSARSCHKMCLDPDRQQIFILGRYLDSALRVPENLKSDFYLYDIYSGKWTLITDDTASMAGPNLIFDHQMCIDSEKRVIYVFGGKELRCTATSLDDRPRTMSSVDAVYSGLYAYHVSTNSWSLLRSDSNHSAADSNQSVNHSNTIRSRVGHCMLFDNRSRLLYIFAGQRNKTEYLSDFFTYRVDSDEIQMITDSSSRLEGGCFANLTDNPSAGTTQRATIDVEQGEIHVLSGLTKDKEKKDDSFRNSFWVYNIAQNRWSCIYRNTNDSTHSEQASGTQTEPCPRFAHQLVYNSLKKIFYLFGGNPGRKNSKMRLDDFWQLKLSRPDSFDVLRKCKVLLRKTRFHEMVQLNPMAALNYLQTELSDIIDHADREQEKELQLLAGSLFDRADSYSGCEIRSRRSALFDSLAAFFPAHMSQPHGNLTDLIQLDK